MNRKPQQMETSTVSDSVAHQQHPQEKVHHAEKTPTIKVKMCIEDRAKLGHPQSSPGMM